MSRILKLTKNLYEQREVEDGIMGDVTFIVESERIRAHRYVLAAVSEKYKAQFFGPRPDEGDIHVNGVTAAAFKEFLKLFYFDDMELSIEHIGDVLDLAKQSLVDDFVDECIDFLKRRMTTDNLCSIYRLAIAYDIEELKDLCEEDISTDTKALFATEDFANCDRDTFEQILLLDSLACSEVEVFDACIAWARAACNRNQIDASQPVNLRAALANAVTLVPFGSMAFEEFAIRHKSLEGFFTPDESNEIFYIIAKSDGIQSHKFNPTPRSQSKLTSSLETCKSENVKAHSFSECQRVGRQLQSPEEYNRLEILRFRFCKGMHWNGFALASDSIDEVVIEVLFRGSGILKSPQISFEKRIDETLVIFNEAINITPCIHYTVIFNATGATPPTFHHTYDNRDVLTNDTMFTFENIQTHSSVSRLLYTPV